MKEQMAFEKNVFDKTSRTDSRCPPLPGAAFSHAPPHLLHLDTSVPASLTHPQAIPFSSELLFPSFPAVLFSLPLVTPPSPPSQSPLPPTSGTPECLPVAEASCAWGWSKALPMAGDWSTLTWVCFWLTPQNGAARCRARHGGGGGGTPSSLMAVSLVGVFPRHLVLPTGLWKGRKETGGEEQSLERGRKSRAEVTRTASPLHLQVRLHFSGA